MASASIQNYSTGDRRVVPETKLLGESKFDRCFLALPTFIDDKLDAANSFARPRNVNPRRAFAMHGCCWVEPQSR